VIGAPRSGGLDRLPLGEEMVVVAGPSGDDGPAFEETAGQGHLDDLPDGFHGSAATRAVQHVVTLRRGSD
jgi:hypothetical protein